MSRALLILNSRQDRDKACAHCGATFHKDPRNTWAYWERAKYCSRECAGKANSIALAESGPSLREVFATKFIQLESDECWPWIGNTDKDGYGVFKYAGRQHRAPRTALDLDGRPVPKGMYACHHCDNPMCVNPAHLYVGTPRQNAQDAHRRGRARAGIRAKLTENDVREIREAQGTHESIAARYGVSRATISLIRERKSWRHVK